MRTVAVGLLVLAAVVYVATLGREEGFWGFVNAGAEASMVGAIADWFAVTALFKHPLGLPIPHTALVPKRKDELGKGLEEFVGENFLQEDIIRDRVAAAAISARVGDWLTDPLNARRLVDEVSDMAGVALGKVRDDHIADLVTEAFVPRFREEPISPLLGSMLMEVLRDDLHHGVVDLALAELHGWLLDNPETFSTVLAERAPWWAPPKLNDAVTGRLHVEALRWIEDIRDDPDHHAREALDSMLGQLARDLLTDAVTQERAEAFKNRLLDHPQVVTTAISLWKAMRAALLASLRDREGAVRRRLLAEVGAFADRLASDEQLRSKLDSMAADASVFLVSRYGAEVTTVITHTIERWDGREAARRIELHVGRDLQFIRINGTLVGGLVGVLIHAGSVLLH
ncbi:MAG: probable membrane protein STY4873 [uncultured Nocardioides sp.]|uniref:Probable membrane protein STY4873 n=1 Tax=uncultured Nocardioides sp. TaxID=198441 RepID=A0A6J4P8K8_9ACTN|nr:MAG: probable membrane protein STY4873 [uncultured Nocardioides sp.]